MRALLLCPVLLLAACGGVPTATAPDTRATDEAAIRAADTAWAKASESHQVDAVLAAYEDNAISFGANSKPSKGKEAIRRAITEAYSTPGFSMTWTPIQVDVARSGEIGYSRGRYQMFMKGAKGEDIADQGTYLAIWRRQPDGTWRVAEDIATSEVPVK
jgi:uncharacterized protein (TIGR02246 family)